uniref:Uncharacterized protein n=1 Tax=Amphimedon queenslandica TaxID=400682 RepID=A0A1X7SNN8_AMPQE
LKSYYAATAKETNKFNDDISMQACESYVVHKTKDTKDTTKDSLYECPDINVYDDAIYLVGTLGSNVLCDGLNC